MSRSPAALLLALGCGLAACAPLTDGGPPFAMAPGLADNARIDRIVLQSDMFNVPDDFSRAFSREASPVMNACATGDRGLEMRVYMHALDRDGALRDPDGMTRLHVQTELRDRGGVLVGRYETRVAIPAADDLATRRVDAARAIAADLCGQAFTPQS